MNTDLVAYASKDGSLAHNRVFGPRVRQEIAIDGQAFMRIFRVLSTCGVACPAVVWLPAMFLAVNLWVQTAGSISGFVADTTSGVIPGAAITLTNVQTNSVRHTVGTRAGDDLFYAVSPGIYSISVTRSGFESTTIPNVRVQVQQALVLNLTLHLGVVSQTVTVAATNDLLQDSMPLSVPM
jgi:hypothetical protein